MSVARKFLWNSNGTTAVMFALGLPIIIVGVGVATAAQYPQFNLTGSLGNEASFGPHLATMADRLRALDPTRPVQYESCGGAAATDIVCPMYPSVDKLRRLATVAELYNAGPVNQRGWLDVKFGRSRPARFAFGRALRSRGASMHPMLGTDQFFLADKKEPAPL